MLLATAIAMRLILGKIEPGAMVSLRYGGNWRRTRSVWRGSPLPDHSRAIPRVLTFRSFEWRTPFSSIISGADRWHVIAAAMMIAASGLWAGLLRDMRQRGLLRLIAAYTPEKESYVLSAPAREETNP
jgi:hypothetical protein